VFLHWKLLEFRHEDSTLEVNRALSVDRYNFDLMRLKWYSRFL
jgi:hypothetical protein